MKYEIIGSSSAGNCIIVEDILMLDCGLSYKKIKEYLKKVKLIFISHSHQDHINMKTIEKISYLFPNIKFVTGSIEVVLKLKEAKINSKNVYILELHKKYDLGLLKVKLEQLYHDTMNCALKCEINNKKLLYAVDTSKIDHIEAKNYDLYLIESNYNEQLLQEHIDNCEDENMLYYLDRVSRTHLSDAQCNDFLIKNMGDNSAYEKIHKSSYNYKEID